MYEGRLSGLGGGRVRWRGERGWEGLKEEVRWGLGPGAPLIFMVGQGGVLDINKFY